MRQPHGFLGGGPFAAVAGPPCRALRNQMVIRFEVENQIPAKVIPAPTRTSSSRTSPAKTYPRRTATMGMTNAMYDAVVASTRFRSHRKVTNVTTEPAKLRYRMAPIPAGHEGTSHLSPAVRETAASATAPIPIASPLKLTGSTSCPHRFTATFAADAHAAAATSASIGKNRPAVAARWPRKITTTPPKPRATPATFCTDSRSARRTKWAAIAVWNGYVAKRTAESPLSTPLFSP